MLYVSDMGLLGTAVNPHGLNFMSKNFKVQALIMLCGFITILISITGIYHIDSPVSGGARGFSRGSIYTKSGRLVASTSQEGLMRVWD